MVLLCQNGPNSLFTGALSYFIILILFGFFTWLLYTWGSKPWWFLFVFNGSSIFSTRSWLTWERTTSALRMKTEHWSVSSANSPNRHTGGETKKQGTPPHTHTLTRPPSILPSIHPSLLPHIPSGAKERERKRQCVLRIWTQQFDSEQLGWPLRAFFFFFLVNGHLSQEGLWRGGLWPWSEAPTSDSAHEARHQPRLCIRGTRTHIPTRASHTSSMHIPRAHEAAQP